jgi:hypothetical protein
MGCVTEFLAGYVVPAGASLAGEAGLKASRHSTGGALSVFETSIAAGPPLHVHDRDKQIIRLFARPEVSSNRGQLADRTSGQENGAGVRAVLYCRTCQPALAVSLQPLRRTGARDEAVRLIRGDILKQVLVEALG